MIPKTLFNHIVDAGVALKIVQGKSDGQELSFIVTPKENGEITLNVPTGEGVKGPPEIILNRLNALLIADNEVGNQFVEVANTPFLDQGKVIDYKIVLQKGKAEGLKLPETIKVEGQILTSDPITEGNSAVIEVKIARKRSMYIMEMIGSDFFREIQVLSPASIPREIHAKLAVAGHLEDRFVGLYGHRALREAQAINEAAHKRFGSKMMKIIMANRVAAASGAQPMTKPSSSAKPAPTGNAQPVLRMWTRAPKIEPTRSKEAAPMADIRETEKLWSPPRYPERTYAASDEELAPYGQPSVESMVAEMNVYLNPKRDYVSVGDYPTGKKKFDRLCVRWQRLGLPLAEAPEMKL